RYSYRVGISYDGTDYAGWQMQPDRPTIQLAMEQALARCLGGSRRQLGVSAAGRTDAGVHAAGQVVQFYSDAQLDTSRLPQRLNRFLPHDIRAWSASRTAQDFHVTISAVYHYSIDTGPLTFDPCGRLFRLHHRQHLDLEAMRAAAHLMVGRHDFSQFSNLGRPGRNPVKHVLRCDLVEGAGFLYKQVRHMVGALLAVGDGRMDAQVIRNALATTGSTTHKPWTVAPAKVSML
ncbi:tRNA pseudouridine synthase, partial [Haematococcus lacustris]